jgi:hypothetical protein
MLKNTNAVAHMAITRETLTGLAIDDRSRPATPAIGIKNERNEQR